MKACLFEMPVELEKDKESLPLKVPVEQMS
jgi:hypothetical protein